MLTDLSYLVVWYGVNESFESLYELSTKNGKFTDI